MSAARYRGTRRELYEIGEERRGRPRTNKVKVFFKIFVYHQEQLRVLAEKNPHLVASQSGLSGVGIEILSEHLDRMAAALGREEQILPAGVVDLESLYLFWNLKFPAASPTKPTTVYLLPGQSVRLGDIRARLRLQIRINQSDLLNLGLALLADEALALTPEKVIRDVDDLARMIFKTFV